MIDLAITVTWELVCRVEAVALVAIFVGGAGPFLIYVYLGEEE